jgi:hypothetical protein
VLVNNAIKTAVQTAIKSWIDNHQHLMAVAIEEKIPQGDIAPGRLAQ